MRHVKGYCMDCNVTVVNGQCMCKKEYIECNFDMSNVIPFPVKRESKKEVLVDMDPGFVGFNMVMNSLYNK